MGFLSAFLMITLAIVPSVAALTWSIETVDSTGSVGGFTSIALDSSGNPHISYYDQTHYDLKYATALLPPSPEIPGVPFGNDVEFLSMLIALGFLSYKLFRSKFPPKQKHTRMRTPRS